MGYYNPIYQYGNENFIKRCLDDGVDGLIVVDLPPEHDSELCDLTINIDLDFIETLIREKFLFGKEGETTYIIKDNGNQK